jgi:hypothetical protein
MTMRGIVCALGLLAASSAVSHDGKSHDGKSYDEKSRAGELVKKVRESTARFRDPAAAEEEGTWRSYWTACSILRAPKS